jgi:hypothetical protein
MMELNEKKQDELRKLEEEDDYDLETLKDIKKAKKEMTKKKDPVADGEKKKTKWRVW